MFNRIKPTQCSFCQFESKYYNVMTDHIRQHESYALRQIGLQLEQDKRNLMQELSLADGGIS